MAFLTSRVSWLVVSVVYFNGQRREDGFRAFVDLADTPQKGPENLRFRGLFEL